MARILRRRWQTGRRAAALPRRAGADLHPVRDHIIYGDLHRAGRSAALDGDRIEPGGVVDVELRHRRRHHRKRDPADPVGRDPAAGGGKAEADRRSGIRADPGLLDPIKHLFSSSGPAAGASPAEAAKARAVEILQKRMKVTRQGTTFLVDIYVSSQSPRKAADIANAVAESYFEEQVRAKNDATRIASNWLNGQIDGLKSRVVAAERAVEDFRSANNLTVSQGVTVNDQQITDLNNQLIAARVQTAEARAKFDQAQQLNKSGNDPGGFSAAISSDIISKLRAQYADIAKNEADLSSKYGPRHPQVANVHAQLRDTQRLINEEIQRILQSARHDYDVARSREASLQQSFDQLQGVSSSSGQSQVRLRELQREAEANRTLYESYLARYKESTAQESLAMPDSHVVTRASIPIAPSWPKGMLVLGLALTRRLRRRHGAGLSSPTIWTSG